MKPIISVLIKSKSFKIGFSYSENGVEKPIKYLLDDEKKFYKFYNICLNNTLLLGAIEDETMFSIVEITESHLIEILRQWDSLTELGFEIRVPKIFNRKPKMEISLKSESNFKMSTRIKVDGMEISPDVIKRIQKEFKDIIFFNGKWQVIDSYMVSKLSNSAGLGIYELLEILQSKKAFVESNQISIINMPIVGDFKHRREHFNGTLKEYQEQAVKMLYTALKSNKNTLLADDMGLGKTITIIFLINMLNNDGSSPNLIVVPKSLTGNWSDEFDKFAPKVTHQVVNGNLDMSKNTLITTYGHLKHNKEMYQRVHWNLVVIDEAQQIKNPETNDSKILCSLISNHKIAMTGTPIENSIVDLWAIFKFLNPEILGDLNRFKNIETCSENIRWLQEAIAPYFIRRVKTDQSLNLNLPDKNESIIYCDMTEKQIELYNAIIQEFEEDVKSKRRGSILKYITWLKLICNHPGAVFDHLAGQSTFCKFKALSTYLNRIKYDKIIVFTQYIKIADFINEFLTKEYGKSGIVINGNLSAKKRTQIAAKFQAGEYPYIVLTLKAGNSGLTLTEACHVIHFDRWWNPSVENQATDRSHRIGQNEDVNVIKFVCRGTLEERINQILEQKTELFDKVINPLSMSPNEVLDFVRYTK